VDLVSETRAVAIRNGLRLLLEHCTAICPIPPQYRQRPSLSLTVGSCLESFFLLALRSIGSGAVTLWVVVWGVTAIVWMQGWVWPPRC